MIALTNESIAQQLRAHARVLAERGDNLYRVRAFRQAAMAVLALSEPVARLLAESQPVPGIGASVKNSIADFARTGVWPDERPIRATKRTTGSTGIPGPPVACSSSIRCSA